MFEHYLMYGCVAHVTRPGAKHFYYTIEWYMSRLPDGFPISHNPLCTSVDNTKELQLHIHLYINRAKTGNYTFTEPISKIVQSQGQAAAQTPCIGCHLHTRSIQIAVFPLFLIFNL